MAGKTRVLVDVTAAGRKGGLARADALSPEERRASASAAATARWDAMTDEEKKAFGAKLAAARAKKRKAVKRPSR